jgi:hypothetical protein
VIAPSSTPQNHGVADIRHKNSSKKHEPSRENLRNRFQWFFCPQIGQFGVNPLRKPVEMYAQFVTKWQAFKEDIHQIRFASPHASPQIESNLRLKLYPPVDAPKPSNHCHVSRTHAQTLVQVLQQEHRRESWKVRAAGQLDSVAGVVMFQVAQSRFRKRHTLTGLRAATSPPGVDSTACQSFSIPLHLLQA